MKGVYKSMLGLSKHSAFRTPHSALLHTLCAVLSMILLSACGGNEGSPTPAPGGTGAQGGNQPATVNIDMNGFKFVPDQITVPAGSTVVWTNKEAPKHTVTADDNSFDSGSMSKGNTFSSKFNTVGTVVYYCKFH